MLNIRHVTQALQDFLDDDCLSSGAAMAFYTVFSLPPLLTLAIALATAIGFSQQDVLQLFEREVGVKLTEPFQQDDRNPADAVAEPTASWGFEKLGVVSQLVGVVLLFISASAVFGQLQFSLNRVWEVAPDPRAGGVQQFLWKRVWSMGLVLVVGFLLLVSLVLTTVMNAVLQASRVSLLGALLGYLSHEVLTWGLATLLFAAIFRILPDARLSWRDVAGGAAVTGLLFLAGKTLIGWYLSTAQIGADWGTAAGSAVGVLVWVYYSSLIVLFGAELTHAWIGGSIPEAGAVHVVEKRVVAST